MTTTEPVYAIQRLDPRELVTHPRNVRTSLGDLAGLTASIREQGVLEPLVVVPFTGRYVIIAGHRRAAAAIAADVDRVPCIVRFDISSDSDTDADTAVEIAAMLAENIHRENLTAVEEARGVQAMLDLGVPLSKVAKATGLDQKRVKKALGVARLPEETAAAVVEHQLDLDQAAAVALFADEPNTAAKLIDAAAHGPGNFAHALERAQQERKAQQAYLEKRAELEQAGTPLVESVEYHGRKNRRISELERNGKTLTEKSHASCPGRAVFLGQNWQGPYTVEVCTDYVQHGHTDRYSTSKPKPETPEEKDAAREERRQVIENNKAMAAANTVRRAWVKDLLARRSSPPEVLRFAVEEIAGRPQVFSWWLAGNSSPGDKDAAEVLGLEPPVRPWSKPAGATRTTLTNGEHVPDGRLPLQLLAHVAGAIELGIGKDSWRSTDHRRDELIRWLRFLAGQGYTLAEIEQQIVDGVALEQVQS